jgi:two-component sensor histidine kinase
MTPSVLRDKLVHLWRWGLRPGSAAALIFAVCCFAIASGVHLAFRLIRPDLAAYSTYYAAVFFATIVGGVWSGVVTWVLGGLAAWFVFEPTFLTVLPPLSDEIISLLLYSVSCVLIIWGAENYRLVVRRLDVEEHYRRLVVKELNHRIKNKFATVYAVLGNELQAHKDVWSRISGRLRALAAADEFLVKSDGQGADIADILEAELSAYGRSRVTYQGVKVALPPKLAAMLALVFHELATNAAKYGALSVPTGRVRVTWSKAGATLIVSWIESDGPAVVQPKRRGFGTKLLKQALDPFHGAIESHYRAEGLRCDISCEVSDDDDLTLSMPRPPADERQKSANAANRAI